MPAKAPALIDCRCISHLDPPAMDTGIIAVLTRVARFRVVFIRRVTPL
jgi:hypothetical protein